MNRLKKLLIATLSVLTAGVCMLGIASCGGSDEPENEGCVEHTVAEWHLDFSTVGEKGCETAEFRGQCTVCYQTVVKTGGEHDLGKATTYEPTCEEDGYDLAKCEVCEMDVKTNIVDALGHDEKEVVVEPTCTTDGYTEHGCTRCGLEKDNFKPMTGHNVVDGECTYCEKKESEGLRIEEVGGEYWVTWFATCTDEDLIIPATYEGKPIVGIRALKLPGLKHVTIPASVRFVGEITFRECSNLESVTFLGEGNATVELGEEAFAGCTSLKTVKLANGITAIPKRAFANCKALTELTLPANVTSIGDNAFQYCTNLASVTLNDGLKTIGWQAFHDCDALTEIVIPNSVTDIGESAFYDCRALTSVTMGDGVKTIGGGAFGRCGELSDISIPDSVTSIGSGALTGAKLEYTVENGVTYFDGWVIKIEDTVSGECVIKEGTVGIADYAMGLSGTDFNTSLTGITIPNTVKTIGDNAFWACKGLMSLEIPSSVKLIGRHAFFNCDALTSVTIGDTSALAGSAKTVVIDESAFLSCDELTKVTIRNIVKSIGETAFSGCKKLATIEYSGTIEEWNEVETGEKWLENTLVTEIKCSDYIADIE